MSIQYGDNQYGMIKLESSYGTPLEPASADAFHARSIKLQDADRRREDPGDRRGTNSALERAEGRHSATWECVVLLRPSGALGTVCDIADFFEMAFGTETVTGSTSVVYSQLQDRSGVMATIWGDMGDVIEFVRGAVCSNVSITWGGDDWIVLTFSGPAKEFGDTSNTTANTAGSSTNILSLADADQISTRSLIQFASSGTGFFATAIDYTNNLVTLSDTASWASGQTVNPYLPTPTYSGSLVPYGTKVTTSVDGGSTTQQALGGQINISTGMGLLNVEEGSDSPTEPIMSGKWEITGNMQLVVRKTDVYLFTQARRHAQKDMRWTFGDAEGYIMQIDADQVEFDPSPKDIPDSGYATITMPFQALGSSGEDDLTVTMV